MRIIQYSRPLAFLLVALLCAPLASFAQSRSFATITAIDVTSLSNGVQVRIRADGILQYRDADTNGVQMRIAFPNARNGTGKTFFNVNRYPLSYLQLSTPQDAANGIGLNLVIRNLTPTSATVSTAADGQSILFLIQSDRTVERNNRGGAASTGAPSEATDTTTEVRFENGLLSVRAVRADIHQLMSAIAQKSGLSISVDDAVRDRKVSLNLQDVAPESAIASIASAAGLAISQINGIFMISQGTLEDLATYNLSATASFRMQNIQAGTASGLLPNFLYQYVKVNSEQNAVVVTAPQQILAKIGADLRRIDVPSPQIVIEAIAVELTDSTDLDVGLLVGNPEANRQTFADNTTGVISYSSIGRLSDKFQATLRALEVSGKARVRARPQMAVINGRTANIFIGAQRFILTQFTQFGQNQNRIQSVDVGVKLQVTPLTGGNGEITTRIIPEVSNITELDLQSGLPVLSQRRAETTVRVKDGETIAIGGLTLDQEQSTKRKVPFFGDIPLLGKLFRGTKRNNVRTELVVFITPRILTAQESSATVPEQFEKPLR